VRERKREACSESANRAKETKRKTVRDKEKCVVKPPIERKRQREKETIRQREEATRRVREKHGVKLPIEERRRHLHMETRRERNKGTEKETRRDRDKERNME
jgi:hypothetical protein